MKAIAWAMVAVAVLLVDGWTEVHDRNTVVSGGIYFALLVIALIGIILS